MVKLPCNRLIMGCEWIDFLFSFGQSKIRLGITDAKLMAKEFYPVFKTEDFISLANYSIYLKLMIDGKPSTPFSADTIL